MSNYNLFIEYLFVLIAHKEMNKIKCSIIVLDFHLCEIIIIGKFHIIKLQIELEIDLLSLLEHFNAISHAMVLFKHKNVFLNVIKSAIVFQAT